MASRKGISRIQTLGIVVGLLVVVLVGTAAFFLTRGPETQVVTQTSVQTQTVIQTSVQTQVQTETVTTQPPSPPVVFTNRTLTWLWPSGVAFLDPQAGNDNHLLWQMYDKLVNYNPSTNTFIPALAVSWSSNPEATEWTFKLRQGVKFHDGSSFTAADVKYSYERLPRIPKQNAPTIAEQFKSIEIIDDFTIKITTPVPLNLPIGLSGGWSSYIMSRNTQTFAGVANDTAALETWFNTGKGDGGSGPYKIRPGSLNPNQGVILDRFDGYWGGWKPNQVSTIIVKVIINPPLEAQLIATGEADFLRRGMEAQQLPVVVDSPNVKIMRKAEPGNVFMMYRVEKAPLNNVKVRQALSYAIPYDQIVKNNYAGFARRVSGVMPEIFTAQAAPQIGRYEFNMTKARQLLAEAGFPSGLGGQKLTVVYNLFDPQEAPNWELIRPFWAQLGIELDVRGLLFGPYIGITHSANPQHATLQFWQPAYHSGFTLISDLFGTNKFFNFAGYSNPEFDRLIKEARATEATDPARSKELYAQAQKILLFDDAVVAPVVNPDRIFVINKHWTGFDPKNFVHDNASIYGLVYEE
jgi:peptide/nickel transport system substrate-binding protein